MTHWTPLVCVFALAAANVAAQSAGVPAAPVAPTPSVQPALIPFVLPWDDATASVANVASWLDAPAGGRGFITAKEGHLFAGTKRIRLLGVNLVAGAIFPTHEDADKIAARLAKFGVGCVRLKDMEAEPSPKGLFREDGTTIDPEQLEKLDYLVASLKKHGIYTALCLHSGRNYPGLPTWDSMPEHFRGVDNFHPRMIEQQLAYASDLLTHVNPHTRVAYAAEPAVAFIEINNESSLLREWWDCRLDAMPAGYSDELKKQWNAWLSAKYGGDEKLRAAWNARETPAGKELFSEPDWRGWSEHPQYPTSAKLQRVEDKRLFSREAGEAMDAALAKRAAAAVPAQPAAPAGAAVKSPALVSDVPGSWIHVTPGSDSGGAQYVRQKVPLDAKIAYTFSFEAKSDRSRPVTIAAMDLSNYSEVARTRVQLSSEWKKYAVTFTPERSLGESQFGFTQLAEEVSDWYFADLSLKPAALQGMHADERIGAVGIFLRREFMARTSEAQRDWVAFLMETETKYWTGMARYLKENLNARSLVIGTQVSHSPFPVQARLDVVDVHGGWRPPRFHHKQGDPADWDIRNTSMLGEEDGGAIGRMGAQRVAGKPFVCTEYDMSAPNTYSSEAFLLLGAYAALQDWDAIFAGGFAASVESLKSGMVDDFHSIAQHPTKMATLPAVAAVFVRGDVATAQPRVLAVQPDQVIEQIRKKGPVLNASHFGARQEETLRHPVQLALSGADVLSGKPVQSALPGVTSDTLDLRWSRKAGAGVVTIDTAKSAGVIGCAADTTFAFMQVSITPHATRQDWATVTLTVTDGADFQNAGRILITATGYAGNTNMGLKKWGNGDAVTVGKAWGNAPSLVEGVGATITFPLLPGAKAWALDERGRRRTEVPVKTIGGRSVVEIGPELKTLWYEVEAPRSR